MSEEQYFKKAYEAIINYDSQLAESVAKEAVEAGIPPQRVLEDFHPAANVATYSSKSRFAASRCSNVPLCAPKRARLWKVWKDDGK